MIALEPTSSEERRILIVVKTYPNPSQTYVETVCCAGVDLASRSWMRLYPIRFRLLADKRFAKYQVIRCHVRKAVTDPRPESYRIDEESIVPEGTVPASGGWAKRFALMPPLSPSLDAIQAANRSKAATSLGWFRPKTIKRLVTEPAEAWSAAQRRALQQETMGLDGQRLTMLNELEQIPWKFSYEFECADERCRGHKLSILDWELGQSYRSWSKPSGADWEALIREKYEREFREERDLHLVVGTVSNHPHTFVIVGLIYPPRPKMDSPYVQQTLDLMGEQGSVTGVGVSLEAEEADTLGRDEIGEALHLFPDET